MTHAIKWLIATQAGALTRDQNTMLFARKVLAWFRSDRLDPIDPMALHWLFCQTLHRTPLGLPSLKSQWAQKLYVQITQEQQAA